MPDPIPHPAASGHTSTTGVPLYWCAYGPETAEKALVLHGGPGAHHDYLLPQFLRLAERHRLVFYDQRGGGRSRETGPGEVTWQHHVQDLAHVVGELGLEPLQIVVDR